MTETPAIFHDDILYHIFSFSLHKVVQFRYSLVCKYWYELTNSEKFYDIYKKYVNQGALFFQATNDRAFGWCEFICHLYPVEYEKLIEMRKNMSVDSLSAMRLEKEFKENFAKVQHLLHQLKDDSKVVNIDCESGKTITLFLNKPDHITTQYIAIVNILGKPLHYLEYEHCMMCSVYIASFTFSFCDNGWGDCELIRKVVTADWLFKHFSHYIKVLTRGVFLEILERLMSSEIPYGGNYSISLQANQDTLHPMFTNASRIIKSSRDRNSLLKSVLVTEGVDKLSLLTRLLYSGYRVENSYFERAVFNSKRFKLHYLKFFLLYHEHVGTKDYAIATIYEWLHFLIFHGGLAVCEIIHEHGIIFPKELVGLCLVNDDQNLKYDCIDFLKKVTCDNFYTPFDLRMKHTTLSKTPKVLVLHGSGVTKSSWESFFENNPRLKQMKLEQRILPKRITKTKNQQVELLREIRDHIDIVLLNIEVLPNHSSHGKMGLNYYDYFRKVLNMLNGTGKRVALCAAINKVELNTEFEKSFLGLTKISITCCCNSYLDTCWQRLNLMIFGDSVINTTVKTTITNDSTTDWNDQNFSNSILN